MPNYAPGYLGIDPMRYRIGSEGMDGQTYRQPFPEATRLFATGRQSENVQDQRGASPAMQEMFNRYQEGFTGRTGEDIYGGGAMPSPMLENQHTQAVDRLVARLQGYAPSRQALLAPDTVAVPDMSRYYTPEMAGETDRLVREATMRRMLEGDMGAFASDWEPIPFPDKYDPARIR